MYNGKEVSMSSRKRHPASTTAAIIINKALNNSFKVLPCCKRTVLRKVLIDFALTIKTYTDQTMREELLWVHSIADVATQKKIESNETYVRLCLTPTKHLRQELKDNALNDALLTAKRSGGLQFIDTHAGDSSEQLESAQVKSPHPGKINTGANTEQTAFGPK
jgi:hypothetical protein